MTIIITGASRGIGFELVKLFLGQGHEVFCLTRNTKALEHIGDPKLKLITSDLSDESAIEKAMAQVRQATDHIDILVNNAGSLVNREFTGIRYDELEHVYRVNVFAPFKLAQLCRPLMGKDSASHIVNISSMGGFQGSAKFAGLSAYSSSKAAIAGLTECLAEEFKGQGISVNCLALGAVGTEMLREAFPGYEAPLSSRQMAEYIADFSLNGHKYYNGKILPVSLSTP